MNWYLTVLKKYATFQGRARRKEYWYFALVNLIISFALGFTDGILIAMGVIEVEVFWVIYWLATLIPNLAVSVRRLHDIDKSGWWLLLNVIPLIGQIVLFVFACLDGTKGANRFGDDPKQPVTTVEQSSKPKLIE